MVTGVASRSLLVVGFLVKENGSVADLHLACNSSPDLVLRIGGQKYRRPLVVVKAIVHTIVCMDVLSGFVLAPLCIYETALYWIFL